MTLHSKHPVKVSWISPQYFSRLIAMMGLRRARFMDYGESLPYFLSVIFSGGRNYADH